MNNTVLQLKVKQRLNKLDSSDYDNIECWQIVEAFNKAQSDWCRRNLHGLNALQEGDEQSKRRIDDLQVLLTDLPMPMTAHDLYEESDLLPGNYFEWKRVSAKSKNDCCDNSHNMRIFLAEEANVNDLLSDYNKKPSYEWGETFVTLKNNHFRIYTNGDFTLEKTILTYYRQPRHIEIQGCSNPEIGSPSTANVECEFKEDLIELFIDEAVKILAGDLESFNQQQTASGQVEGNN